jgi:tetratricopeptide (TPR) repeat protein
VPRLASLSLCLALFGAAGSGRAEPTPAAERAILRDTERHLARGETVRAERGLARGLKRAPTPRLVLRYAELALPLAPAANERERLRRQRAAALLLEVLAAPGFRADQWAHQLTFHAAWAEAQLGSLGEGLALLERAAVFDPARGLPYLRALATLAWPSQPGLAEQSLVLAHGLSPADGALLAELGLLWLAQGKTHEALALLAERYAEDPSLLSARRDYAAALSAAGRPGEALALLGAAREACRDADLCLLELARFGLEARTYAAALRDLEALRARAPHELSVLFLEADVRLAQGEPALARALYQRILAAAPDNLRARAALLGLAEAAAAAGDASVPPSADAATTRP